MLFTGYGTRGVMNNGEACDKANTRSSVSPIRSRGSFTISTRTLAKQRIWQLPGPNCCKL